MQIGNCGSPIETEEGWLLMTHGVGPMRQYCIGATLLDRDEPWPSHRPDPRAVARARRRSGGRRDTCPTSSIPAGR